MTLLNIPRIAVILPKVNPVIADWKLAAYFQALIKNGAAPFALPPTMNDEVLSFMLSQADGLLISGGIDIEPSNYGMEPEDGAVYDPDYDRHCFQTFRLAMQTKMPILGICRGEQLINVACGGTLIQDVPKHRDTTHPLQDISGRVAQAMGTGDVTVNSFHHQVVDRLAPDFTVTARSQEGYVEAIEHTGHPYLVGVQWHPERMSDSGTERFFCGFIKACAELSSR